jgi:hypothetical protein
MRAPAAATRRPTTRWSVRRVCLFVCEAVATRDMQQYWLCHPGVGRMLGLCGVQSAQILQDTAGALHHRVCTGCPHRHGHGREIWSRLPANGKSVPAGGSCCCNASYLLPQQLTVSHDPLEGDGKLLSRRYSVEVRLCSTACSKDVSITSTGRDAEPLCPCAAIWGDHDSAVSFQHTNRAAKKAKPHSGVCGVRQSGTVSYSCCVPQTC